METTDTQTLKTLQSLQEEVKNLKKEITKIEDNVLRERLRSIEETLAKNHLSVYANQRSEHLTKEIDGMLKSGCESKPKCYEKCKNIIESNAKAVKLSSKEAIEDMEQKIVDNQQMIEKTKGYPCEDCFQNFDKILRREKRAYKEIVLVERPQSSTDGEALNISFLIEVWLEPLSSDARLRILDRVYHGKRSFSELSRDLGLKAGHLVFHLRKLTAAKLITQEASKGDYILTDRGLRVIKKMLSLQNEEPDSSALQG
ncbi:MAG: winged helix-turn-helix domain-containing protein [Candidatus Bathyarchaeia archaeon]|jgi:DNA-binding HxlR family transcriptional regulator